VRRLLKSNASRAFACDDAGRTPLHYLCASGLFQADPSASKRAAAIAGALVDAGADVDAEWIGKEGDPRHPARPIWWATSFRKHAALVATLLELGADAQDALHLAGLEAPYEILELLLAHGAKLNRKKAGRTALHFLLGHRLPANTLWFLEHGANPNVAAKQDGYTPLHYAASFGARSEVLQALVDHGARLDAKDKQGKTPLAVARAAKKKKTADWLRAAAAS